MTRPVNERDFRRPEFLDAKVEDCELRSDGAVVRKDRWERAVREICSLVGLSVREFEIDDVVDAVRKLQEASDAGQCDAEPVDNFGSFIPDAPTD